MNKKELGSGVNPVFVAPDGDNEIHGHKHHFPEEVEEEKIQGQEDARYAGQHPQQVEVEKAGSLVDFRPGGGHGHDSHQGR